MIEPMAPNRPLASEEEYSDSETAGAVIKNKWWMIDSSCLSPWQETASTMTSSISCGDALTPWPLLTLAVHYELKESRQIDLYRRRSKTPLVMRMAWTGRDHDAREEDLCMTITQVRQPILVSLMSCHFMAFLRNYGKPSWLLGHRGLCMALRRRLSLVII